MKERGKSWVILPGIQRQGTWEQLKAVSGDIQTGHEKVFLYQEGCQTLEQAPREVVEAPNLSVFKSHLDNDPNNLLHNLQSDQKWSGIWTQWSL